MLAPFAVAEIVGLLVLNSAISLKGGVAGHDLLHTLTPAGSVVKGVVPGGTLGIGSAMTLAILAFIGFETIAVYGEEARTPRRAIATTIYTVLIFLSLLSTWTPYSATIGVGWRQAGTVLGNVNNAPLQYVALANHFVGAWLGIATLPARWPTIRGWRTMARVWDANASCPRT